VNGAEEKSASVDLAFALFTQPVWRRHAHPGLWAWHPEEMLAG